MRRNLTAVCALSILILGILTLTLSTHAKRTFYTTQSSSPGNDVVWVEDAVPAGATPAGTSEGWNWTNSNPSPLSGTLAHTSDLIAGFHQHYFYNATQTLTVNPGDILIAHVYLDPLNPSTQVMLQWNDGTWEHRAYWGANQIDAGIDGTVSRRYMGALPSTGQWVRLEVPASLVGLEGRTLNGMAFTLFNGRATWDRAGKYVAASAIPTVSISDAAVNEGNSGNTSAVFTVTLSSASTQTITVNYATANGTATSPSDYAAASGTLVFAPGLTSQPLAIPVVGDTVLEPNENFFINLSNPINATVADGQGVGTILNDDVLPPTSDVVWVEDALPAGATPAGTSEGWNWTNSNPSPLSGTLAHTSDLVSGFHQHYFYNATQTLTVNPGDILIAHVYLDPLNLPTEIMLQWNDGTWEHRAYWGANQIDGGVDGTVNRRYMGALPSTGQWVRLEVPASLVGLEGRTLNGMAFTLFNGRATWDRAGKYAAAPVIPTVSISDATVNEGNSGNTSAVFTVTLSGASTHTVSVNYATADGTATSPTDYIGASGTLTFAPGQTSQQITIPVVGDTVSEANENFLVNLSNPVDATLADSQGVGTIVNDDAPPTISINDVSVNEPNSGTTSATFTVTLSSASEQTISVNYATANGTATSPSDYVAASGKVTFGPRETSQLVTIQVVGDTVSEANENFFVNLSAPVNATLADSQGAGTILNLSYFEIPVYFHVIQDTNGDGFVADSTLDAQIDVLNGAFNGTNTANIQFFFRKVGVTRNTNHDWFQMEFFDPPQESGAEYEAKRTLRQGGANALNFYTTRGGTPPQGSPYRFGWGMLPTDYTSDPCRDGVVVPFTTLPGDTTPNNPFNAGDLPVHEVGHWLGLFHTFQGDSCAEPNDQIADTPVHLNQFIGQCPAESTDTCPSSPGTDPIHNYMTNYSDACKSEFTRGQFERVRDQYITYRQSSTPPSCPIVTMSISDATVTEGNSGGTFATFTVTLSGPSSRPIVADFATADGTANAGSDYIGLTGTVNFAPQDTTPKTISVQVIGDTTVEPNETFFVNLSNPRNVVLADSQGVGTILNDDAPLPSISISDVSVNEGNCDTPSAMFSANFNVTLSSASTQTISVNYATANGTATSPSDYIGASGTVTFGPGQTSQPISIQVVGDTAIESNENFFVNLWNPVNATLADSQGVGTILNDDSSQQPQGIKYFGYLGASTDSDLLRVRSYTNFTYVDGEYGQSITGLATRVKNNGMRSLIDLGKVLWCPTSGGTDLWHLCGINGEVNEVNYKLRWNDWVSNNLSVLNSSYVLAFSVMTEPVKREVSKEHMEIAIGLVTQTNLQIPTLVVMGQADIDNPKFYLPCNADWIGFAAYYTHPNLNDPFTNSNKVKDELCILKSKKKSWQRMAYTLDGFYGPLHQQAGLTLDNMDSIAQEWYTFASGDPEAILIGVFLWPDLPTENAIGSISFPPHVLDKHAAIGAAILAGRAPTYQGSFDRIDCQSLGGWAWDTSQPNTPISVDIYDGTQKIATVRANQSSPGIGNGQHGFTFTLPTSLRDGQTHSIAINYSGLDQQLSNSPRSITCVIPPVYEGWVDVADCNSIIGWAADRNRLNTSITVGIYDDNTLVTTLLASDLRSDVGAYLGDNGRHGFAITTPWQFKDGLPHTLRVKFESGTTELSSSPRTISCAMYYEIVARHSGKCIDVEGDSTAAGARVIQFGCGGWANQQFHIIHVGGGYFKIVARHSGKVLDVQWGGLDNGTPVWQWDDNGSAAQQWQIIDVGGGYFKIVVRHSGKALDVTGGSTADLTQIQQWDYFGNGNQQWLLRPVP